MEFLLKDNLIGWLFMEKKLYENEALASREEFGNRIRKMRKEKGITQDKLSELTDISARNISDIENGKVNSTYSTIYVLAKAFGITMSELLDLDEKEE